METEYERLKKQFDQINKNRNTELIDSYINILAQNEQEILSLNTELNDRDNLITNIEEEKKKITYDLGAQIYELEQSIENLREQLDNIIEQRDRLQNNLIEKEEVNAELRQTIIAKTQREIILENRLNDGNK